MDFVAVFVEGDFLFGVVGLGAVLGVGEGLLFEDLFIGLGDDVVSDFVEY